jgi:hypothetical protein
MLTVHETYVIHTARTITRSLRLSLHYIRYFIQIRIFFSPLSIIHSPNSLLSALSLSLSLEAHAASDDAIKCSALYLLRLLQIIVSACVVG